MDVSTAAQQSNRAALRLLCVGTIKRGSGEEASASSASQKNAIKRRSADEASASSASPTPEDLDLKRLQQWARDTYGEKFQQLCVTDNYLNKDGAEWWQGGNDWGTTWMETHRGFLDNLYVVYYWWQLYESKIGVLDLARRRSYWDNTSPRKCELHQPQSYEDLTVLHDWSDTQIWTLFYHGKQCANCEKTFPYRHDTTATNNCKECLGTAGENIYDERGNRIVNDGNNMYEQGESIYYPHDRKEFRTEPHKRGDLKALDAYQ